ncbi:BgTH12-04908 [Blumeria graminis f. sp. triticale]|uniref:BgTH12-04908 n=1 Tax=Blumeria graminis f. sp. triticale TaxID=1689686 RepID=A0A9W4CVQ3_BLUGR|nr:BgTH12-04908 [Blumeria graminis f. sp. triticale]
MNKTGSQLHNKKQDYINLRLFSKSSLAPKIIPRKSTTAVTEMNNFNASRDLTSKLTARKRNLSEFNNTVTSPVDRTGNGCEIRSEWMRGRPNARNQSSSWREETVPSIDISPDKNEELGDGKLFSDLPSPNLSACRIVSLKNSNTDMQERWSSFAIQAVHAVAEKAWEFCKNSAALFSGFHAGGGTKYKFKSGQGMEARFEAVESSVWPGEWHMINAVTPNPKLHDPKNRSSSRESTPVRSSKRCQIHPNKDSSLEKNWVVIPPMTSSPHHTRARAERNKSLTPSTTRLSNPKSHSAPSSRLATRPPPILQYAHQPKPRVSYASSASLKSPERASFASPRPSGTKTMCQDMPASPAHQQKKSHLISPEKTLCDTQREAQQWAAMIEKDEQQQDDSLRRLESRLKTMIREGKAALGTKIEMNSKTSGRSEPRNLL